MGVSSDILLAFDLPSQGWGYALWAHNSVCPSSCHPPPGNLESPRARPIPNFRHRPPRHTSPRPRRMSPVSAGAPSLAVAMTVWLLQRAL